MNRLALVAFFLLVGLLALFLIKSAFVPMCITAFFLLMLVVGMVIANY